MTEIIANYAEVDIGAGRTAAPAGRAPQAVPPASWDECRARFHAMRQIADMFSRDYHGHSFIFCDQAAFMCDFEDDYAEYAPFTGSVPCYEYMGHRQLRTYFTWRARVRRGQVANVSPGYAFVYVYELLNNIGIEDPVEGFGKLVGFWNAFRQYDPALDGYMPRWLKDYYVYYGLPDTFQSLVVQYGLVKHYPEVFVYDSDETAFNVYSDISRYDARKSRFFEGDNARHMTDGFLFVIERFRELCAAAGKCFEDLVYSVSAGKRWRTLFGDALFYPSRDQQDRKVVISKREWYCFRKDHWMRSSTMPSSSGRDLVTYMMRSTESALRIAVRYTYNIKAKVWHYPAELKRMGIDVDATILEAVAEYFAIINRKTITVDDASLNKIRKEAADTRDKLLVPDDGAAPDAYADDPPPDTKTSLPPAAAAAPDARDVWAELFASFTSAEKDALASALRGGDIKEAAAAAGVMPEVLADGINQKAMDALGDVILEFDGAASVYEDYAESLIKMMETVKP
ncbi:MAG: TerB N-terminal domain-containing protein [Oscillospiraceae bacterium]|nr:TerB N-terminal domain-containing protein [Oscillospiraceae bacterium]